ncbi:MAG: universal stress protein [Flammeovirgaceae bacterium]
MFKNILVPTDFSENAQFALEVAIDFAKRIEAGVTLLKVVDMSSINLLKKFSDDKEKTTQSIKDFEEMLYHGALNGLNRLKKSISHKEFFVETKVILEEHAQAITRAVLELDFDLVVIGNYYQKEVGKNLFDVTTRGKLIHLVECPILMVNHQAIDFNPTKIVFASQLREGQAYIIEHLKEFHSSLGSECHLLVVNTSSLMSNAARIKEKLSELQERTGTQDWPSTIVKAKSIEEGLMSYAQEEQVDLIVVYTESSNWAYRLFMSSLPIAAINQSKIPVMVYPKLND